MDRYSLEEAREAFPDKYILLKDMKQEDSGLIRGILHGLYDTRSERAEAALLLTEELGITEGKNFLNNKLGVLS